MPREPFFVFQGEQSEVPRNLISLMNAWRLLRKGCQGFLAFVKDVEKEEPKIGDVLVVKELMDVFPDELSSILPDREVEFHIELAPKTRPISMPSYQMAPIEFKELKAQLQDLLDKGFIRPNCSPWGFPL